MSTKEALEILDHYIDALRDDDRFDQANELAAVRQFIAENMPANV